MDLWIRSQDRRILQKVDNIFLNANYENKRICSFVDDYEVELATYKSKERALEVLDEIQEAQLGNFHYRCPSNVKVSSKEDTIVYEMPGN